MPITGYPNPKINALLAHVGDFDARDFLDLAMASLDQSDLVSRRDYELVRKMLDAALPEGSPELGPRLDSYRTPVGGAGTPAPPTSTILTPVTILVEDGLDITAP